MGALTPAPVAAAADGCARLARNLDARIDAARVGDPRHPRLAASPWLRTRPFLHEEFRRDLGTEGDATRDLLEAMAELDREARARELTDLPGPAVDLAEIERCRSSAVAALLAPTAGARRADLAAETLPDRYSEWQRRLGLYPIARPFLLLGARAWQRSERAAIAAGSPPLRGTRGPAPGLRLDRHAVRRILERARERHPLGWPVPDADDRRALVHTFAPVLARPSDRDADRIGRLAGTRGAPAVETGRPVVYFEVEPVRWGPHVLLQIVYTAYFPERPARFPLDPYAGAIDGLIWRVTLADDGAPLLWDSIHPCGCYHSVVLPQGRRLAVRGRPGEETPLLLDGPAATAAVRLRYAPGTHLLRAVESAVESAVQSAVQREEGADAPGRRSYELAPHDRVLETGNPGIFRPDGLLAGTQRLERFWLWPSGILSPGAMRSPGHHAIAFAGRARFRTAELLGGRLQRLAPVENPSAAP